MDEDIEYFKNLINEYEVMLPSLNDELNYYKMEFDALKRELMNMDKENKMLSLRLEENLRDKVIASEPIKTFSEPEMVSNLKSQLSLTLKEKKSVCDLWKTSMKRIDYLETELRVYTGPEKESNCIYKLKKNYEKQIKRLQHELKLSNEKLEEAVRLSKESLQEKKIEMEKVVEKQEKTIATVQELEKEIDQLTSKYNDALSFKEALEKTLEMKNKIIADLKIEAYNAKLKVTEACHVIEVALVEKDAALLREKAAKNDVEKLSQALEDIVKETEDRVKAEVNVIKEEYKSKLNKFEAELKRSHQELELKTIDLEKRTTICNELEMEIDRIRKTTRNFENTTASEKTILTKKIEEIYEKLLLAEKSNIQLSKDNDALKKKLEEINIIHETTINSKDTEKKMLEMKIGNLQNELEMSNSKLVQVALKVEDLNEKVKTMDAQFSHEYELKNTQSEKLLTERISEIETVNMKINNELRSQLQSQILLNKKWKHEVRQLTDKLEGRIKELRCETSELKEANKDLERKLSVTESKCSHYRATLQNLCIEFHDMADMFVSA